MRYSTDWEDYELIDCSDGYKLERWTNEILVRPDPQVIWKSKKENKYWFQPDATYLRSRTRRRHMESTYKNPFFLAGKV